MATPFLSVVIPAYNEETRISATLSAVVYYLREQEYTWEVVVVDDGSTDVAAAHLKPHARLRVIHQSRSGLVAALEAGRAACLGM